MSGMSGQADKIRADLTPRLASDESGTGRLRQRLRDGRLGQSRFKQLASALRTTAA